MKSNSRNENSEEQDDYIRRTFLQPTNRTKVRIGTDFQANIPSINNIKSAANNYKTDQESKNTTVEAKKVNHNSNSTNYVSSKFEEYPNERSDDGETEESKDYKDSDGPKKSTKKRRIK